MKKNLFNRKNLATKKYAVQSDDYISNVDFSALEVTDSEKITLIEYEKRAKENSTKIKEHIFNLAEIFYNAQQLLSDNDKTKGKFLKWIEEIGFGKSFVYETLDRYNLYLKHNNNKVFELPVRTLREVKKLDDKKFIEVIDSEKPSEKIKELKAESYIEEAEVVENTKEYRLKIILNRLEELEKEKTDLIYERNRLEREIKKA